MGLIVRMACEISILFNHSYSLLCGKLSSFVFHFCFVVVWKFQFTIYSRSTVFRTIMMHYKRDEIFSYILIYSGVLKWAYNEDFYIWHSISYLEYCSLYLILYIVLCIVYLVPRTLYLVLCSFDLVILFLNIVLCIFYLANRTPYFLYCVSCILFFAPYTLLIVLFALYPINCNLSLVACFFFIACIITSSFYY